MNPSNPPSPKKRRSYLPYCDRRADALRRLGLPSPLLAKQREARIIAVEAPLGDLAARVRVVSEQRKTA
jgi:hypothetical protein